MLKLEVLTLMLLLTSFGLKKKNTLSVLLSLEVVSVIVILIALLFGVEMYFALLMICIGACEGAVGLSALIAMTRINMTHYPSMQ